MTKPEARESLATSARRPAEAPLVPYRLAVCGLEELEDPGFADVSHLVSFLDPSYEAPVVLDRLGSVARLSLRCLDVIEEGEGAPSARQVEELLAFGESHLRVAGDDHRLLVHCHAGVSRSTAALTLLLAQARPDLEGAEILAEVRRVRRRLWPNLRMIELGSALLGRQDLVAALRVHYAWALTRDPSLRATMIQFGRGREIEEPPRP